MQARAEAAAATGDRIVESAIQLFTGNAFEDVGLDDVAAAAGVSVRTVLRRFGTKEALFAEADRRSAEAIIEQRGDAPVGDVKGAIRNVLDHYEDWGDQRLMFLAQEHRVKEIRRNVRGGRALHREWVERVFEPLLPKRRGQRRERQVMALVTATDVYTWKLLRRDWGLARNETERTIEQMVKGVLENA